MSFLCSPRSLDRLAAILACTASTAAIAQVPTVTTLEVIPGAPIQEVNIAFGQYFGQEFVVDPTLTINLRDALGNSDGGYRVIDFNGATLNVLDGGFVASRGFTRGASRLRNANINLFSGGVLDDSLFIDEGSVLTMFGGTFRSDTDEDSRVGGGARLRIEGGVIEADFFASEFATVEIAGGVVEREFAAADAFIFITGGTNGDQFTLFSDTVTDILVQSASINGEPLILLPGQPRVITERSGIDSDNDLIPGEEQVLETVLSDGTPFDFTLNPANAGTADYIAPPIEVTRTNPFGSEFTVGPAVLTVTAVDGTCFVDINDDGTLDLADITAFLGNIGGSDPRDADVDAIIGETFLDVIALLQTVDGTDCFTGL